MSMKLLGMSPQLAAAPAMLNLFSDERTLQTALQFEAAAARALVQKLVEQAVAGDIDLATAASRDSTVSGAIDAGVLARLFEPTDYLGSTHAFIERTLSARPTKPDRER